MGMANKHIKKQNSVSFVTRKIEVKPDTTTHMSECLKLKRLTTSSVSKIAEQLEFLYTVGGI